MVDGLVPRLEDEGSLVLAVAILGATVMPHAIYLHSALVSETTEARTAAQKVSALRTQRVEVTTAMGLAGLVNVAMLLVAAALFAGSSLGDNILEGAFNGFGAVSTAALLFALALLASGLASSSVGTYAGQVVMAGFLRRRIPLFVRRAADHDPRAGGPGPGSRPDLGAGGVPGGAVLRHPVRPGAAGAAHPARRTSWASWSTRAGPRRSPWWSPGSSWL